MTTNTQDALLYGLMTFGPDCWYQHASRLDVEMFDGERREIFSAIQKLNQSGEVSDMAMVADAVSDENKDLVIHIATTGIVSRSAMKSYVTHLQKAWAESKAKDIGAELLASGDIEGAKSALMALPMDRSGGTVSATDATKRLIEDLSVRTESEFNGLNTGLTALDNLLGGIEPSDLCIVAGRPSMGKTALMLNMAVGMKVPCGIFSLEMSTAQLMTRMTASYGVNYGRLRRPATLHDLDWPKVTHATRQLNEMPMWINDTGGMAIGDIESEAYRMVKTHGVRAVFIDYLQLVRCSAENRLEAVSEISRRLKALAKNLHVSIVALSQMNRAVEKRGTPAPVLSDLRESGQIEQDADQIIFVYRPEVLNEANRPGEADLIVAKNRGGETGTAKVVWQGQYQRFQNFAVEWGRSAA